MSQGGFVNLAGAFCVRGLQPAHTRVRRWLRRSTNALIGIIVLTTAALLTSTSAQAQACSASGSVDMAGQTVNGTGVTLSVASDCNAIKTGLYQQNGANTGQNYPVSGSGGIASNGDTATFTTAKATYRVEIGPSGINAISGYIVDYKVTITALVPGETGGNDSFALYYAAGADANQGIYGNATTPWAVTITNLPASGPTATQSIAAKSLTQNQAASFTPVTGSGGAAPLSYGISPSLPAGLTISSSTGTISGTPTATSSTTTYTVTVTDANSSTANNTFSLTVNPAVTATQAIPSKTLTQNQPSSNFTPVTASSGTPSYTYGISPTLPSGLTLNTSTGAITGTPTAISGCRPPTPSPCHRREHRQRFATRSASTVSNAALTATQAIACEGH